MELAVLFLVYLILPLRVSYAHDHGHVCSEFEICCDFRIPLH